MRKLLKLSFLFFALTFLILQVSASTFGSFPEELEKNSDELEFSYSVNLVNIGNETLEVELQSEGSEEYNISFPENSFELEPNTVEDNPSGSNWYHVGNGRYTKVRTVPIEVDVSRYRDSNDLSFPVQVRAKPVSGEGGSVSSQIVRIREHNFRGSIDPSLRPETREGDSNGAHFWQEEQNREEDFNFEDSEPKTEGGEEENQSKMNTNRSTEGRDERETDEDSGIDSFTYLFAGGIAVSITYVLWVA